jgi:putative transposase
VDAVVVLPDHLHCIWRLPEADADFSTRWRLVKRSFSLHLQTALNGRSEKVVWQRRYWEHLMRDEQDWRRHMDYIHYNPVKHGYALTPTDWPYSSFHRAVACGLYDPGWGAQEPATVTGMDVE